MMIGQQYYTASVTMKVENLTKVYASSTGKVVSLNNVSFAANKGEFVSVVGPSGSGKSTLLNMLGALDRPTSGKVKFFARFRLYRNEDDALCNFASKTNRGFELVSVLCTALNTHGVIAKDNFIYPFQ